MSSVWRLESIPRRIGSEAAGAPSPASDHAAAPESRVRPARSLALTLVAAVAVIFLLREAHSVFIPFVLGVLLSYALNPLVQRLTSWSVPRLVAATIVVVFLLAGVGWTCWALTDNVSRLVNELPDAARRVRISLSDAFVRHDNPFAKMQEAASELQRATIVDQSVKAMPAQPSSPGVGSMLWYGSLGAITLIVQITIVLFLMFFLLASGDHYKRKLLRAATSALGHDSISERLLEDISRQIERFLVVRVAVSVLVGLATWLAFFLLGVEEAAAWGVAAGVLNIIPYFGPMIVAIGTAIAAFTQFGTLAMAAFVSGASLAITGLEGCLLTPWLSGRAMRMNAIAVFVGLIFWGWIWGAWGAILAVPLLAVVKAICDRVEECHTIAGLIGE